MDLLKVEPGSCNETCLRCSYVGNKVTGIKVQGTDMTEEEGQEPMTSSVIKAEPEVRCMYVH
jgi:hypothetical protein